MACSGLREAGPHLRPYQAATRIPIHCRDMRWSIRNARNLDRALLTLRVPRIPGPACRLRGTLLPRIRVNRGTWSEGYMDSIPGAIPPNTDATSSTTPPATMRAPNGHATR